MAEPGMLAGKKVLIVDDEPDVLEVLQELLDMCRVSTAATFEQAKALIETQPFDIAILDIMGVNGYGLLALANQKKIPAVMLTAHAFSPDNLKRTVTEGGCAYIPKEEISGIGDFLVDVLTSRQKGRNPWAAWQDRLPSSYFEKRWGAAWKSMDRTFLDQFRDHVKTRNVKKS